MTLADLLALAEKAAPMPTRMFDLAYQDAASPELVAALVRCVMAANLLLNSQRADGYSFPDYDAARAELDRVLGAER